MVVIVFSIKNIKARRWWLTPAILAIQEAEIRIVV
jgi:hypothetical protein